MKKLIVLAVLGIFAFAFVGCGETTTEATTTAAQTTTEGTTVDPCVADPFAPECLTQDNIILSYADWGDSAMNQALIDAFMAKYPNIQVSRRTDFDGLYGSAFTDALVQAQTAEILPDVFSIDNVITGVNSGMLADVSEFYDMDPDVDYIYPNIRETALYNGKRLAIPSFQFIKGILLNMTLFDHYGIDLPDYDWTYDEFLAISVQLRQAGANDNVYAIEPLDWGAIDFESIFPTQDDASVGYNTWDGTEFHFTSQSWIDAFNLRNQAYAQELITGNIDWDDLGVGYPWFEGYVGMKIAGSWNLGMVDTMYELYGQEVGFWPYPGGDAGQFPPVILDYTCVSSQSAHPKEAYALAKWMTFGREGWLTRFSVMEAEGNLILDRFPIANYPEVWEAADDFIFYVQGLQENIDLLEYSKPDVDKWLPGYSAFWEWVGNPENDYWTKIEEGSVTPEVFAQAWEDKINEMVQEAMANIATEDDE